MVRYEVLVKCDKEAAFSFLQSTRVFDDVGMTSIDP